MKPEYRFELKLPEATSKEYKALRRWMVRKGYALPRSPLKSIREEYLIEYLKEYQNEQKMAIIKAPFTEDEVYNLNKWQTDGRVHPFTCGTKEKHKPGDDSVLIAVSTGWVCPSCDYKQDWAHGFMTSPINEPKIVFPEFPEMSGEEAREYLKSEGLDPDELAKHGVVFVRMASLLAKIKLAAYEEVTPLEKIVKIKGLIQQHEKETQD